MRSLLPPQGGCERLAVYMRNWNRLVNALGLLCRREQELRAPSGRRWRDAAARAVAVYPSAAEAWLAISPTYNPPLVQKATYSFVREGEGGLGEGHSANLLIKRDRGRRGGGDWVKRGRGVRVLRGRAVVRRGCK